ncbi:hypothetical protein BC832DRAFT_390772 [Gaertneriomyces semiglobifer]|nr:hypothetical protein BC832DRAFT_390772 [Gaertneriomyces semiglobifer]
MIMEVQSKFHCCGFDKPRDRPWPKGNAEACVKTFGPTPCFPKLQQEFSNINTQLGSILLVIAFGQAAATYVVYRTLDRPKYASAFPQHVPSPYQPYYHHERTPLLVPYPSRDISDYPAHRVEFHPTRPATPNLMDIRSNAVEDWRWDAGTQLQADANGYSAAPPIVPPAVFQQPGVRGGEQQLPESVSGAGNLGVPRQGNEETA